MKNQIDYRHPTLDDVEKLTILEVNRWDEKVAATKNKWHSRITRFPEGMFVAEKEGEILGVIATLLVKWDYPDEYFPTWPEATDNGYIRNHCPDGNILYGVTITVASDTPGVADRLLQLAINVARERGIIARVGVRIPSLRDHVEKNNIKKVTHEMARSLANRDPGVKFFLRQGFKVIATKEDYMPHDNDSLDWGVILEIT